MIAVSSLNCRISPWHIWPLWNVIPSKLDVWVS